MIYNTELTGFQLPLMMQTCSRSCLTLHCLPAEAAITLWYFFNSTRFSCPYFPHLWFSLFPSVCPFGLILREVMWKQKQKNHKASCPPTVHLHVLSQLLCALKFIAVRVTSTFSCHWSWRSTKTNKHRNIESHSDTELKNRTVATWYNEIFFPHARKPFI